MAQKNLKDLPSGFENHVTKVAIVGVSGSVGQYFTKHLLATGKHTVTAITREGSKSEIPSGVEVAKINYDQPETLVKALEGQQALIITMKTGQEGVDASKQLVEAAIKAKVPWVIPNEYGPDIFEKTDMGEDTMFLPALKPVRDAFAGQNETSFIGLVNGYWYEYSLAQSPDCFGFDFGKKTVTFIDDGTTKMNVSTWEQCGRAVASLLSLPQYPQDSSDKGPTISRWANASLHIDSFLINQRDMLESILRVTGDKESDWKIEHEDAKERFQAARKMMADAQQMFAAGNYQEGGPLMTHGYIQNMYSRVFFNDGSGDFSDKLDNELLQLPKEDLDEATKRSLAMVESGYDYFKRY